MKKDKHLSTAIKAAKQAGKILIKNFNKVKTITDKGNDSFVTNVDITSEKKITSIIKENFPEHNLLTEEATSKKRKTDSEYTWIIDPLDGTHEYMHGFEYFGVSIALARNDEVIVGVVYFPISDDIYYAVKGKGAYKNDKKIHVSDRPLNKAYVILSGNFKRNTKEKMKDLKNLVHKTFRIRIYGAAVYDLCNIAEGNADCFIEYTTFPWDISAGFLIVEEAGGKVTAFDSKPWHINIKRFVASNTKIHDGLLNIVNK